VNWELIWNWLKEERARWWLAILSTNGMQLQKDRHDPRMYWRVHPAEEVKYRDADMHR